MQVNNNLVTKEYLDEKIQALKLSLEEKLDWIIGKYRDHDEEHTLINGKLSEYGDRLETLEQKAGITV